MRRPRLAPLVFALAFLWILTEIALLAHEPAEGAPNPDRLASQYEHALRTHDTEVLHRVAPGVPVPTCQSPHATPVKSGTATWIELDNAAGTLCTRLPTARTHGWWIVA